MMFRVPTISRAVPALALVILACQTEPGWLGVPGSARRVVQATTPAPWHQADIESNATPPPAPDLYQIATNRRQLEFLVYESGFADSDTVRITVNGETVPGFDQFDAGQKPATFSVELPDGVTRVTMTAVSNGACEPNTTCLAPHPRDVRGRNVRAGGRFMAGTSEGFRIEYVESYGALVSPQLYFTPQPY